jgi:ATP phosphoribosyltransferase
VLDDGVILKSQAQLAASLSADWTAETRAACERLLGKLDSRNALFPTLGAQLPG